MTSAFQTETNSATTTKTADIQIDLVLGRAGEQAVVLASGVMSLVGMSLLIAARKKASGVLLFVVLLNFTVVGVDPRFDAIDVGRDGVSDLVVVLLLTSSHLRPFLFRPSVRLVVLVHTPAHDDYKRATSRRVKPTVDRSKRESQNLAVGDRVEMEKTGEMGRRPCRSGAGAEVQIGRQLPASTAVCISADFRRANQAGPSPGQRG